MSPIKRVASKAAPAPATRPVKKAVSKMAAAPRSSSNGDDDDDAPRPSKSATKKTAAKKAAPAKSAKKAAPARRSAEDEQALRGGWSAAQETMDSTSTWAAAFKPTTSVQIVKLLEAAPYASYRRHWIDRVGVGRRAYTCLESVGRDCPLCDVGDKPAAVAAFNIALVGDDGEAVLKSWDCGARITQTLKTFANDPKIGPLDKRNLYFAVSRTEASQRQQVQTLVNPVRERDLQDDYDTPPLDDEQIERLLSKKYTNDIVELPRASELEEVAAEMLNEDGNNAGSGWGS